MFTAARRALARRPPMCCRQCCLLSELALNSQPHERPQRSSASALCSRSGNGAGSGAESRRQPARPRAFRPPSDRGVRRPGDLDTRVRDGERAREFDRRGDAARGAGSRVASGCGVDDRLPQRTGAGVSARARCFGRSWSDRDRGRPGAWCAVGRRATSTRRRPRGTPDGSQNQRRKAGNVRLAVGRPGLFIETAGATKEPAPAPGARRSLKAPKAGRLVRTLCEFAPPFTLSELATRAAIDGGYASRLVTWLAREDLLTRRPREVCRHGFSGGQPPCPGGAAAAGHGLRRGCGASCRGSQTASGGCRHQCHAASAIRRDCLRVNLPGSGPDPGCAEPSRGGSPRKPGPRPKRGRGGAAVHRASESCHGPACDRSPS